MNAGIILPVWTMQLGFLKIGNLSEVEIMTAHFKFQAEHAGFISSARFVFVVMYYSVQYTLYREFMYFYFTQKEFHFD